MSLELRYVNGEVERRNATVAAGGVTKVVFSYNESQRRVYAIGDNGPAGGLVFYDKGVFSDGWRYLEAAPGDQASSIQWLNTKFQIAGAEKTGIGAGKANTATIISSQGKGYYAAAPV